MRRRQQPVAITPIGHQAVIDRGRCAKLLDQEQSDDQKQQGDGDTYETRGLAGRDLVAIGFPEQRTMCIQTALLLHRGTPSP